MGQGRRTVKATETAFAIIEVLETDGGIGVTRLADRLDLSKGGVYKHLATLRELGYVRKDGDEYYLGIRFFGTGAAGRDQLDLFGHARPKLDALADTTGECVSLVAIDGGFGIRIYTAMGSRYREREAPDGERFPLVERAVGRVILAHRPEAEVSRFADDDRSDGPDGLSDDLQTIRERHMGFTSSEQDGRRAVAVPILGPDQFAVGAIRVSGTEDRMRGKHFEEDVPGMILSAIRRIEAELDGD